MSRVSDALQEKDEYVENIIADLDRLGLQFEKITYTSDYFPQVLTGRSSSRSRGFLPRCGGGNHLQVLFHKAPLCFVVTLWLVCRC